MPKEQGLQGRIGLGIPNSYSGIFLYLIKFEDEDQRPYSGLLLSGAFSANRFNGLAITGLGNYLKNGYGIAVGPLFSGGHGFNGVSMGGIVFWIHSGITVGGVATTGDTVNGMLAAVMFFDRCKGHTCSVIH